MTEQNNPFTRFLIQSAPQKLATVTLFGQNWITGESVALVQTLLQSIFGSRLLPAAPEMQAATKIPRPCLLLPTSMNEVVGWMHNSQLQRAIGTFDVLTTDGMPLVWLAKLKGTFPTGRLYGPTLMKQLVQYGRAYRLRHYLYGGTPTVLSRLVSRLAAQFPGFFVAGEYAPPFRDLTASELRILVADIRRTKPDVLWLGVGSERQVLLAAQLRTLVAVPLIIPVGAAFDFLSGSKRQAPQWLQQLGLEWGYRLLQEPNRLWRRYVLQMPIFIVFSILELCNYLKQSKKTSQYS